MTFKCPVCEIAGGRHVETLWPTPTHTKAIIAVLAVRHRANRNWVPWESIDFLERENVKMGLPPRGFV